MYPTIQEATVTTQLIRENGKFPNNETLPVVLYKGAFPEDHKKLAEELENIFKKYNWVDAWRNGIYEYHHYHSSAHEVLGVSRGYVIVELGGPDAFRFRLKTGDVVVLPAGIAHKNIECSKDFECIGAYPKGQEYDIMTGKPDEKATAEKNIKAVPVPLTDPLYGRNGFLMKKWRNEL